MNPSMIGYVVGTALLAHGVGHAVGVWGPTRESVVLSSWVSTEISWAVELLWMIVSGVLFVLATLAFFDVVLAHQQWRVVAIIASVVSTLGIIAFWGTWPESAAFSALVFDLVVLVSLLVFDWPPESVLGFEPVVTGS